MFNASKRHARGLVFASLIVILSFLENLSCRLLMNKTPIWIATLHLEQIFLTKSFPPQFSQLGPFDHPAHGAWLESDGEDGVGSSESITKKAQSFSEEFFGGPKKISMLLIVRGPRSTRRG